ncbi:hypothetical protein D046_7468A, partial [Vibrio parahaemolyticus V-223/04]
MAVPVHHLRSSQ